MNYNFNYAQCIKEAHNFGEDIYYNICAGTAQTVPWGTMDYLGTVGLITMLTAVTVMVVGMVGLMIYDLARN